jgi:hypothetical protein
MRGQGVKALTAKLMLPEAFTAICVVAMAFVVGMFIGMQNREFIIANASKAVLLAGAKVVAQPTRYASCSLSKVSPMYNIHLVLLQYLNDFSFAVSYAVPTFPRPFFGKPLLSASKSSVPNYRGSQKEYSLTIKRLLFV